MSSVLITNNSHQKKGYKKKTLSQRVQLGANSLVIFTAVLLGVITLTYLVHSNQTATKGYVLKQLQQEQNSLAIENEIWDMRIARARSLSALGNNGFIARMIRPEQPIFVRGDSAFAKN